MNKLNSLIEFGDQLVRRCWNENMSQRGWAPRPSVEQPRRTRTTHGGLGRSICCSLCSVSNSLSHTQPFQIKWEVYFFKEVFTGLYSLRQYVFCMYMCIYVYVLYVCIVNHGHDYTTLTFKLRAHAQLNYLK